MKKTVLEPHNDGMWFIATISEVGERQRLATVYRMKDGWHTKLASVHTRHAWSGPYDSPEAALDVLSPSTTETLEPQA
jgi:hypothetical protein